MQHYVIFYHVDKLKKIYFLAHLVWLFQGQKTSVPVYRTTLISQKLVSLYCGNKLAETN